MHMEFDAGIWSEPIQPKRSQTQNQRWDKTYCGWTKSCTTLKLWETIVCWYLQGNQGFRPSTVRALLRFEVKPTGKTTLSKDFSPAKRLRGNASLSLSERHQIAYGYVSNFGGALKDRLVRFRQRRPPGERRRAVAVFIGSRWLRGLACSLGIRDFGPWPYDGG